MQDLRLETTSRDVRHHSVPIGNCGVDMTECNRSADPVTERRRGRLADDPALEADRFVPEGNGVRVFEDQSGHAWR